MKKSKIIDGYDLSGVSHSNLHGLTLNQYYNLLKYQNFECPVSTYKFVYDEDKKKFIDSRDGSWVTAKGKEIPKRAPSLDHCHETQYIRGFLTENVNRLLDQWDHKTYGNITYPIELMDYKNNPPAYEIIGKIKFK
tara:strand:+ start:96 stop:503 length:408 start_codon:yes stop_codon:yes gene_type:complete